MMGPVSWRWARCSVILLGLAGWIGVNALAALGTMVLMLAALGGFTMRGTMAQAGNLALRFADASFCAQDRFTGLIFAMWAGLFALAGLLRRQALVGVLAHESGEP